MSLTRRPHSAMATSTHYDLSTKQYRVPQPQSYNKLKNDIYKTFSLHTSATYNDIMQLTGDQYHKRIDRLCSKYCIKPQGKNSLGSGDVDSEFIARNFVRRKSRQRQGSEMRNYMQVEIRNLEKEVRVSKRKREGEEFFKLTTANLKRLQAKEAKVLEDQGKKKTVYRGPNRKGSAKSKSKSRYDQDNRVHQQPKTQRHSHPYLKIYQQSQQQALHSILNHDNIALSYQGRYPHLPQADQLQKYQKHVKGIYSGIKRLRYVHSAREVAKTSRSSYQADRVAQDTHVDKAQFYIT